MPNGNITASVVVPNADDATLNISINLRSYAFDFSLQAYLVPFPIIGTRSLTTRNLNSKSPDGNIATAYSDLFYNHIWILPSTMDLSGVPAGYSTTFVVWNSYFVSRTLTAINLTGSGVTTSGYTLPETFTALQTKTFTLSLLPNAPASISAVFAFIVTGVSENATLTVTGTLAVIYAYRHNWNSSYKEKISYLTTIIEAKNGYEQRIRMRKTPRRFYQVDSLLADSTDFQRNARISALHSNQIKYAHGKSWLVFIDADIFSNNTNLTTGATTIPVDDTRYLDIVDGGYLAFYRKFDDFEIVTIDSYTQTSITLVSPLVGTWPKGSKLIPVKNAFFFESDINSNYLVKNIKASQTNWLLDVVKGGMTNRVTSYTPTYTYRGADVYIPDIDESENQSLEAFSDLRTFDSNTGIFANDSRYSFSRERFTLTLLLKDKETISRFYGFLDYRAGRLNPMWVPTDANDIQILNSGTSGSQVLKIRDIGYSTYIKQDASKRDIALFLNNGTILFRRINGSVNNGDGTEDISVDSGLGITWDSTTFKYVSFLRFCRFDSDDIEVEFITHDKAKVSTNLVSLTTSY